MNIIYELLDKEYVLAYFHKRILPQFPQYVDIENIEIKKHKNNIWETTYHVVFEYRTTFIKKDGVRRVRPIFVSAHKEEPRREAYYALRFLHKSGLFENGFDLPKPLWYSKRFGAIFYRGVEGESMYRHMKLGNKDTVLTMARQAGHWLSCIYQLNVDDDKNFNPHNSRIKTVIPGAEHVLNSVRVNYPEYFDDYANLYEEFIRRENEFLARAPRKYLVHGDFHPENMILNKRGQLGVIDFTDICLSDYARDLGCFQQQMDYMIGRKMNDEAFAQKAKEIFLSEFLSRTGIEMNNDLRSRIDNYYAWTSIRTASFFLMKHNPEPERAKAVLEQAKSIINK